MTDPSARAGHALGVDHPHDLSFAAVRLERAEGLDGLVRSMQRLADQIPRGPVLDALQGGWLGHAAHPMFTDLPIGFWTGSMVLDLIGGRRARPAADLFVALGLVTAVPTVATGLADWTQLSPAKRRVGAVHAASNVAAIVLYAASLRARRRHHRATGIIVGLAAGSVATVGGYLGGHLAFGTDQTSDRDT